jgi:cytochrome P450
VTAPDLDLTHPSNQRDPFPVYRWLRDHDPVHWSARLKMWVVTRYDDVSRILQDPVRYSSDRFRRMRAEFTDRRPDIEDVAGILRHWAVYRDPPDHTRLRGLLNNTFTPRTVERVQPRVQRIVDDLLDRAAGKGTMDFIADFAFPLPATVIGMMLGVPITDLPLLKTWSDQIATYIGGAQQGRDNIRSAGTGLKNVVDYFRALIRTRRGEEDDLIALMLAAENRGAMLSEDEVVSNCILLLFAGHETTTDLLGNGLLHVLRGQCEVRLRRDPALIRPAIEEMLRYDPPVAGKIKVAIEDVELHGRRIAKGDLVAVMLASANRDPRQFDDPDAFVITREGPKHLAFGQGIHFCLGASLARLEAQIAFATLLRRCANLRMTDDVPRWKPQIFFRGLSALHVAVS